MKKINQIVILLGFASLFLISCTKEEVKPNKNGLIEFGFNSSLGSTVGLKGSIKLGEIVEPAAVVLSIKDSKGELVYNMERVELFNMNGNFISKPLSLLTGNYTLEKFIVVDAFNKVIYVAPIVGSPKAYLVDKPLPLSFSISKDVVTKVVPEVVNAEGSTPEEFGYSTFGFSVVNTFDFLLGVFVFNDITQNFELTNAELKIESNGKILFLDTLSAITNIVTVADGYSPYILTVTKEGYQKWVDTLSANELKLYYSSENNGPLEVVLVRECNCPSVVVDIDGNIYGTVVIGDQCWMKENLRVKHYNDGESLEKNSQNTWMTSTIGSYEWPDKDQVNVDDFGLLYNWKSVESGKLCPVGWHVPSSEELSILINRCGGENIAGVELKDSLSFYATASGLVNGFGATQFGTGYYCWSKSTWYDSLYSNTKNYYLSVEGSSAHVYNSGNNYMGLPVRCIKNSY